MSRKDFETVLAGGLGSVVAGNGKSNGHSDTSSILEDKRKKLLARRQDKNLSFLKKLPKPTQLEAEQKTVEDGRLSFADVADHVNDVAENAYIWITQVARPFLRELDKLVDKVGPEILDDIVPDGDQLYAERRDDYESYVQQLLDYSYEDDREVMDDLELFPARQKAYEKLYGRIHDQSALALLVDDLAFAEDKDVMEDTLENRKWRGQNVFAKCANGKIRAFGTNYKLADGAFGRYHEFAEEKLQEAVNARAREIATAHAKELEDQTKQISSKTETDISPEELFFGEPEKAHEKTSVLRWSFYGKENVIRVRRKLYKKDGHTEDRLYILSVVGIAQESFVSAGREPFVLLDRIKDGDHLCFGERNERSVRYDFSGFIKPEVFRLACWIRTAAGHMMPQRLFEDDTSLEKEPTERIERPRPKKPGKPEQQAQPPAGPMEDNDGTEAVGPEEFFFRKASGTITIRIVPEDLESKIFVLKMDEARGEDMEVIAPEREVVLEKPAVIRLRRLIKDGKSKLCFVDCDLVEVMQEFYVNGIVGVEFREGNKKGWQGLPNPIPGLLSYRYKQACEAGEISPKNKK